MEENKDLAAANEGEMLEREYQAITRKKVSEKIGEDRQGQALYRTIGQELKSCAWWEDA